MQRIVLFLFLISGNVAGQPALRYDVVIDEIMADPTPAVQLPAVEFIELKNISGRTLNLSGWKIATSTSVSAAFPSYNLLPDSFLIIGSSSATTALAAYGKVLSVSSFPSLDNDGTIVTLTSKDGSTIHAVNYNKKWYQNEVKADGGWTLEMIDPRQPCLGIENWKANQTVGGTPGKKNSVEGTLTDDAPPELLRSYTTDSITVNLVFNEPVDSISASRIQNYLMNNFMIVSAKPVAPLFTRVQLKLNMPMEKQSIYEVEVKGITDCKSNPVGVRNKVKSGLSEIAIERDLIINEILFDPPASGNDYVEVFNRSKKIIDLSEVYVANRTSTGAAGSLKKLSEERYFIYPGEWKVVTTDEADLSKNYFVKDPEAVVEISSLPSFPDDEGNVLLLNLNGIVIDEVNYSDDWHFPLLKNTQGVSLERIFTDHASNEKSNWQSAASSAGYGTPGYRNSQQSIADAGGSRVDISPKVCSPDNDGRDDYVIISYRSFTPGYMANIMIFNSSGFPVRTLFHNALMGNEGSWKWDGLGEQRKKLPTGIYIVSTEVFNVEGKVKRFKHTVVIAEKK